MSAFFAARMDYVYAVYGLSFVILGIVCLMMTQRVKYRLTWKYLGYFGVVHGINEWLDLGAISFGDSLFLAGVRTVVLVVSFVFLIEFAYRNSLSSRAALRRIGIYVVAVVLMGAGGFFFGMVGVQVTARYFLGFAGALWAGHVLYQVSCIKIYQDNTLKRMSFLLFMYGIASGLVVPALTIFPVNVLNQETFLSVFGFPVQLLRCGIATVLSLLILAWFLRQSYNFEYERSHLFYYVQRLWLYVVIALILAIGYKFTENRTEWIVEKMTTDLLEHVKMGSLSIDPSLVQSLSGTPADLATLNYAKLKKQLEALSKVKTEARFVYLMRMQEGKAVFLVDAEPPESEEYSPPGQVYEEAPPDLIRSLMSDKAFVEAPYEDRWGKWYSGFAPVPDDQGRVIAFLGMDIDAHGVKHNVQLERSEPIMICLLLAVIAIVVFFIIMHMKKVSVDTKESEERLKFILEGSRDGTWESSSLSPQMRVNDRFMEIIGCRRDEIALDVHLWETKTHPEDWVNVCSHCEDFFKGRALFLKEEFRMAMRNGEWMWVLVRGKGTYLDKKKNVFSIAGTLTDITDQKKAEMDLRWAQQVAEKASATKSEILANVSHEIGTPMNAIIGFSDLLAKTSLTESQSDYVNTIRECSQILLSLVENILNIAQIEKGHIVFAQEVFDLEHVIVQSLKIVAPKVPGSHVTLAYDYDPAVSKQYEGDAIRVKQVLLNLLNNAIKFTARGSITVSVKPYVPVDPSDKTRLCITVRDTGIGIPAEQQAAIFEAFVQADASVTRQYGGTGLGLAIVKAMVTKMGGKVWVESEVGKGSCFTFTL